MADRHRKVSNILTELECEVNELKKRVRLRDANLSLEEYEYKEILGQGAFGTVIKAKRKSDNILFAVKFLQLNVTAVREALVLSRLEHGNIVKMEEVFLSSSHLLIVMEYCEATLADALPYVQQKDVPIIAHQILAAIHHMHQMDVVHRDLKPANILLKSSSEGMKVKICDFGLAVHKEEQVSAAGTNYYIAPEVISNSYNEKADMWSFGMILVQLLNKELPFRSTGQRQIYQEILSFDPSSLQFGEQLDDGTKGLIMRLLEPDSRYRASAQEALEAVKWPSVRSKAS